MRPTRLLAVALVAACAAGCSRRPAPAPIPPATPPAAPAAANDDAAAREAAERARLEAEEARRREAARVRAVLSTPVYFDYDAFSIRDDSRRELDLKAPLLRDDPSIRLMVTGHTDERGSTEYNLALGMRRAEAVREYLANFGIASDRVEITSYGEESPVDGASTEAAWARNRRAEFEVTSGPARGQ